MAKNNSKVKLSIIILAVDSLNLIKSEFLDLSKIETSNAIVDCIIVDNGSTDNIYRFVKKYKLPNIHIKYISNGKNLGFAEGNNIGIKYALSKGSDYILLLNNDMIIPRNLVTNLIKFMEGNKNVGIVSPKIYFAKGYEYHRNRYKKNDLGNVIWYAGGKIDWDNIYTSHIGVDEVDKGQYDKIMQTEIANGACVLIRKQVFEKIGLLDKGLFLYWEDTDFCQRAIRNGFEVYYMPKAFLWHKVSTSSGGSGGKSNDYFLVRNRYFFAKRYAKFRTKLAVLKDTVRLMFFGKGWQKIGALHALIGKKGAGPWVKS